MDFPFLIVGGGVLGAVVGSFLATAAIRMPAGRSLLGRSACDACGAPVAAFDLVPILSFLRLRGQARCCRAPIDPLHPAMEATAATIGAVALALAPGAVGLLGAGLGWALLLLAVLDARHYWLPDRITAPLLAVGLVAGPAPVPDRALAAAIAGGSLLGVRWLYRRVRGREGLGLGDVKLAAALGAWLSPVFLAPLLVLASALGLLLALRRGKAGAAIPFGSCLAVAGWLLWAAATGA